MKPARSSPARTEPDEHTQAPYPVLPVTRQAAFAARPTYPAPAMAGGCVTDEDES